MSVTVVSCVYGTYADFKPRWWEYVQRLNPKPDAAIIHSGDCDWKHPQAWHLNRAIAQADTEWVWILDIDDCAMPDALAGLDQVDADVWQMGFVRSDGEVYTPPQLTNAEYLASWRNVYVAASAIRTQAFRDVGGFDDIALQDWGLWRRLAAAGATFLSSGRTHFHYMRHARSRGENELTMDVRPAHIEEMLAREGLVAA